MKRAMVSLMALAAVASACVGSTGGALVEFPAEAAGPSDAVQGQPLAFTTDRGWSVVLTKATLHVGALYLDQSVPVSGAGDTQCILPGTYVAQVTSGLDVDLLSPALQAFPASGQGTVGAARLAQVWLTGGDVNAIDDRTPILQIEGTATKDGDVRPFAGTITIGANRAASTSLAGADPPCKERIASIPTRLSVHESGSLVMRVDPRLLFLDVDFAVLTKVDGTYAFQDDSSDPASSNLYSNLHSGGTLYTFAWTSGS